MKLDFQYIIDVTPDILCALPVTIGLTFFAMTIGALLGIVIAIVRMYNVPVLSSIFALYVSFIRGVPLYVQLFVVYYAVPKILNGIFYDGNYVCTTRTVPAIVIAICTFVIYASAYISEIFRGALMSVDSMQMEAAHSVGMSGLQGFIHIIFPQAIVIAIPNYCNFFIGTLKATSLVFCISLYDIMGVAKLNAELGYRFIESYAIVAVIYLVLGFIFINIFKILERKTIKNIVGNSI